MPLCELCGEPMPEGEEMFKYHGYSGPCPRPPLAKVHSGTGPGNIVPQGPTFHWKDGWMFARGEGRYVHVWNIKLGIDEVRIPPSEWDSIVAAMND